MSNIEKLLVVKSRGRGGIQIQQHDWSLVQRRLGGLHNPDLDSAMDGLLAFAQSELPEGREVISVEIAVYAFDRNEREKEMGRKQVR